MSKNNNVTTNGSEDYFQIEKSRPIKRRAEEIIRAEASKLRKTKTIKEGIKTGFRIRKVHEAHKYMQDANDMLVHACDLFLTERLERCKLNAKKMKNCRLSKANRKEIIEKGVDEFMKFDERNLSYYLSAALIDNSNLNITIASNAFHNFLGLHTEKLRKTFKSDTDTVSKDIKRQAREIWRKMSPEQKFPFFLQSYLSSYYPRGLDGSIRFTIETMTPKDIEKSLTKAEKNLLKSDAEKIKFDSELVGPSKRVRFNVPPSSDEISE